MAKEISTEHMVTVAALIEKLKKMPQDAFVIMSSDSEGNGYSPFADMSEAKYAPETTWSGEIIGDECPCCGEEEPDCECEEEEKQDDSNSLKAVVFYAVN